MQALNKRYQEIEDLGGSLLAISPQTVEHSRITVEQNLLDYDVLSDSGNEVIEKYGLAFTVDDEIQSVYKGMGINLDHSNGNTSYKLPVPATYIIDSQGIVRHATLETNYTVRMEPDEVVEWMRKIS